MKKSPLPVQNIRGRFRALGHAVCRHGKFAILLAGTSLLADGMVHAANTELDVFPVSAGSNLSSGTSYTNGNAPTATSDVTFDATDAYTPPYQFTTAITIGSLDDLSATAITISGGTGAVTLAGGDSVSGNTGDLLFVANGANLTYSQAITLGMTGNFDVAGTATATFTGNIADGSSGNATTPGANSFGIVKTGTGNLVLGTNDTFTGGLTVNAGTVTLNFGNNSYANVRGAITVNAGGTLALNQTDSLGYSDPATNGNAVTLINIRGGTVNNLVGGNQGFVASLNMTGGTFSSSGGGAFNINPGESNAPTITTNASATTANISAPVVQRSGTVSLPFNVASGTTANNSDLTVSGVISGAGGGITKNGAGTMLLTAVNTYTGPTMVNAGKLFVSGSTAAGAVTVSGTGTTLGGTGTIGGAVTVNTGSILMAGNLALATPATGAFATGALTLQTGSTFNALLSSKHDLQHTQRYGHDPRWATRPLAST